MSRSIELSENECKENIRKFYSYFDDSYKFEEFLKTYLEKIGLDEVVVTRRSGDGGIDLTAVRKGLGGLANAIDQPYFIQAKRYLPDRCVPPKFMRTPNVHGKAIKTAPDAVNLLPTQNRSKSGKPKV